MMTVVLTSVLPKVDILCLLCVRSFMYVALEVDNVISLVLQMKKTKVVTPGLPYSKAHTLNHQWGLMPKEATRGWICIQKVKLAICG